MSDPVNTALTAKDFLTPVMTLLGAIVGGCIATCGPIIVSIRQRKHDRKSITLAFNGEIEAITLVVKWRKYLDLIKGMANQAREKNERVVISLKIEQNYFDVYEANVSKIGLLNAPLNRMIPVFYSFAKSIIEEIRAVQEPFFQMMPPELQAARLDELHRLFSETLFLGKKIQEEIRELYPEAKKPMLP